MKTRIALIAAVCAALACVSSLQAVTIVTVPVGNPGNTGELSGAGAGGTGSDAIVGSVDYRYNIGKLEVTAGQYCDFLNAVATTDTYGLYDEQMDTESGFLTSEFACDIKRSGLSGGYTYSVADNRANRPVNFVSWGNAARFANWLTNDQPGLVSPVPQDANSTEDGSYELSGATTQADLLDVTRIAEVDRVAGKEYYFIPSEDEWYKAAYHKNDGVTGSYFDYPTQSDTVPTSEAPPGTDLTNGSANYYSGGYTIGAPYYRTEVGAYDAKPSDSAYGTFDQGGNVWEWTEAIYGEPYRGLRGGSYYYILADSLALHAAYREDISIAGADHNIGFRLVQVPEPATLGLLLLGGLALLRRRR